MGGAHRLRIAGKPGLSPRDSLLSELHLSRLLRRLLIFMGFYLLAGSLSPPHQHRHSVFWRMRENGELNG